MVRHRTVNLLSAFTIILGGTILATTAKAAEMRMTCLTLAQIIAAGNAACPKSLDINITNISCTDGVTTMSISCD